MTLYGSPQIGHLTVLDSLIPTPIHRRTCVPLKLHDLVPNNSNDVAHTLVDMPCHRWLDLRRLQVRLSHSFPTSRPMSIRWTYDFHQDLPPPPFKGLLVRVEVDIDMVAPYRLPDVLALQNDFSHPDLGSQRKYPWITRYGDALSRCMTTRGSLEPTPVRACTDTTGTICSCNHLQDEGEHQKILSVCVRPHLTQVRCCTS